MLAALVLVLAQVAVPVASPSPCPIGPPGATPAPCAGAGPKEIGRVVAVGRKANLVGKSEAASEGTISQEQIATRPVLRPAEVLEAIPGLVISQHSGEGKANQYYLRGFQLDHGTDLEGTIVGVPVNLPSHAHGQGYSDINWLMPELVSYVEFKKGTYYADQGDFSTAGAYDLYFRNTIDPLTEFGVGGFGYERFFTAASPAVGAGHLLYAVELGHDNGSFAKPDEYQKFNGVLRYTQTKGPNDFALTGFAYNGAFNSSDQIPERSIDDGDISRFGYIDPTDGGNTYRYALSAQFEHHDAHGTLKASAYAESYFLDLFSNFTYYYFDANNFYNETANPVTCNPAYVSCTPNTKLHTSDYSSYCPAYNTAPAGAGYHSVAQPVYNFNCGDQREQRDQRAISGFNVSRSFDSPGATTILGIGLRNDNIGENGLFLTNARQDYADGVLSDDHILERNSNAYVQTEFRAGPKLRITPGVRLDIFNYSVGAPNPNNSGKVTEALLDPKMTVGYAFSPNQELYLDFGDSFHSNDARGVLSVDDPQTHRNFDPSGAPVYQNAPVTRAVGEEIGYRYSSKRITTTVSAYQLLLANELVFDGDHGTTSVGGPTLRKGLELANFFTPADWLTLDADLATATARFIADPTHQGTGVPESLNAVISAGATVDEPRYAFSLRMRYFGPRQLDTAGDASSAPSMLFNTQVTEKLRGGMKLTLDVFNLLNSNVDDVEYYYGSWLPQDAANPAYVKNPAINPLLGGGGVNDFHIHPSEKRTVRLTLSTRL